jgi:DNA-binding response OmpR family regulator
MKEQIRLLVVEDHKESFKAVEKYIHIYFADKNVVIFHAPDLATALKMSRIRGPFAACILDLLLPDSSIENTVKYIYEFKCPVFVVSGSGSTNSRKLALRLGARDYMAKPVVPEMFVDKLSRILQHSHPDEDYSGAAKRAQISIAQKVIAAEPERPWWKRWEAIAATMTAIISFSLGHLESAWGFAIRTGAHQQETADNFANIQRDVKTLQEKSASTDMRLEKFFTEQLSYQRRMDKDMARLLEKNGLNPSRD